MDAFEDACKLSEPEFRKQILAWMQTKEVSQRIQAKLRHDIIDCFSATALGREVTMRQQKLSQHIVPPTSILALNTMVAEFLYTQNCQFTLSVFATEVPFPSALPDFDSNKNAHPYRFRPDQLQDLLRSFALSQQSKKEVESRYLKPSSDHINTSLLFSLLEISCPSESKERSMASKSTQCRDYSRHHSKHRKGSQCLRQIQTFLNQLEESIVRITETMNHLPLSQSLNIAKHNLSKLNQQSKRFAEHKSAHSIYETISSLSNELNTLIDRIQFKLNEDKINPNQVTEIPSETTTMRYSDWVQAIRSSTHGKRFLQHLVEHYKREQQSELEKHRNEMLESIKAERTRLKQLYKERFLNRLQGLMMVDSETAKGRFLSDISKPEEKSQMEAIPSVEPELSVVKEFTRLRLSSRKLPNIEIFPAVEANDELQMYSFPKEINQIAQQTRHRAKLLVEQSDDIESSIQKRLRQHSLENQTIAADQQNIRQRSHIDAKLISGVRCEKAVRSPRTRSVSMEVQCESIPLPDGKPNS